MSNNTRSMRTPISKNKGYIEIRMTLKNSNKDYGTVAKILHWSIALLVILMLAGGFFLDDLPKTLKPEWVNLHKLTGLLVLVLMILRLVWRLINAQPALPTTVSRWEGFLAHSMHRLLYVAVFTMPLAGWIMSTAKNKAPHIGGWIIMAPGIPKSDAIASFFWEVHSTAAWVLIILIALHILAALKHAVWNRDGVLRRMWF